MAVTQEAEGVIVRDGVAHGAVAPGIVVRTRYANVTGMLMLATRVVDELTDDVAPSQEPMETDDHRKPGAIDVLGAGHRILGNVVAGAESAGFTIQLPTCGGYEDVLQRPDRNPTKEAERALRFASTVVAGNEAHSVSFGLLPVEDTVSPVMRCSSI